MLKPLTACLLLLAPAAAAPEMKSGKWTVSGNAGGCIAHSSSSRGTVVSILGAPGQTDLIFLIQNTRWSELRDGEVHTLALELDGGREWQFDAVARTELDSDGPGYLFSVSPAAEFVTRFAEADDLSLGSDGERLDQLSLSGGGPAMTAFAHCLATLVVAGAGGDEGDAFLVSGEARKI